MHTYIEDGSHKLGSSILRHLESAFHDYSRTFPRSCPDGLMLIDGRFKPGI